MSQPLQKKIKPKILNHTSSSHQSIRFWFLSLTECTHKRSNKIKQNRHLINVARSPTVLKSYSNWFENDDGNVKTIGNYQSQSLDLLPCLTEDNIAKPGSAKCSKETPEIRRPTQLRPKLFGIFFFFSLIKFSFSNYLS